MQAMFLNKLLRSISGLRPPHSYAALDRCFPIQFKTDAFEINPFHFNIFMYKLNSGN